MPSGVLVSVNAYMYSGSVGKLGLRPFSQRTLRSLVKRVKDRPLIEQVKGMVHELPCECSETYIGETVRTMETRLKEHKYVVSRGDTNNGIAVHANCNVHLIMWEQTKVAERESFWIKG